jgi:hypothetical protein
MEQHEQKPNERAMRVRKERDFFIKWIKLNFDQNRQQQDVRASEAKATKANV